MVLFCVDDADVEREKDVKPNKGQIVGNGGVKRIRWRFEPRQPEANWRNGDALNST